ncbi:MAG: alpha/beta hydrolase [Tissierellia bacterium]|nr:alpha/beta hydrolase [Tissierellia bacterium]
MKHYEVKFIELKTGEKIAYREAGDGDKTILLVHGNMSSSVHFQPLIELLEKDYKVYALDMVGFGDSTYNREINSLHDFSLDVSEFIKELGLTDLYILGWSTGGGVVLETAVDLPERIKKIFLLSSVGVQGYPMFKKDENYQPILDQRIFTREDIAVDPVQVVPALVAYTNQDKSYFRNIWDLVIYNNAKPKDDDYEVYLEAILKQKNLVDVDVALANFNMTSLNNGVNEGTGRLDDVKAPVVIIQGARDLVVPPVFAQTSKEFFGDRAELVMFENAGHSIVTDDLKGLYEAIVTRIN